MFSTYGCVAMQMLFCPHYAMRPYSIAVAGLTSFLTLRIFTKNRAVLLSGLLQSGPHHPRGGIPSPWKVASLQGLERSPFGFLLGFFFETFLIFAFLRTLFLAFILYPPHCRDDVIPYLFIPYLSNSLPCFLRSPR